MIVLLDTNVWVSSFLNPKGYPAKLKDLWLKDKFSVVISPLIIEEIRSVLRSSRIRTKYHIESSEIELFLELFIPRAITVFPTGKINFCRDVKDNHILEAALLGKVEYIITRDDDIKRDVYLIKEMKSFNVSILSVSQFLKIIL
ncbi:MAG: putative toxin-antitoxin system toxin component, PIN family [Elusimicrobiota bacterium]